MIQKVAQHLLEGIYVDQHGIQKVLNLCKGGRKTRVLLVPMSKSFADPLILYYLNYFCNLELGYSFGSYEDGPQMQSMKRLYNRIGHFLIKRKNSTDSENMSYLSQALMEDVIDGNMITTIFLNDRRLRSGKFSMPMHSEISVKHIIQSYLALKKFNYDIVIVPVSIEYDRTID